MTGRRGRPAERGAETLELVAVLPLLVLVVLVAWQAFVLVRQQSQAQADARELARRAALCARAAPTATLGDVDPQAAGSARLAVATAGDELVRVEVRLVPQLVLPGFRLDTSSTLAPHAVVVMHKEPC